MKAGWHVVCVGELMIDIVARLPGPLAIGSDTPAPVQLFGGGSGANTACWLAELGTPATLLTRVGRDHDKVSSLAEDTIYGYTGITDFLTVDQRRPTGRCIVLIGPDAERTMVPDAGANAAFSPDDVDQRLFRAGRHLHLSGYVLFGPARLAGLWTLTLARATGMSVSVDASSAAPLAALGVDAFLRLVGDDLLLFANVDEAAVLTGEHDPGIAVAQLAGRYGQAIVKRGQDGAVWAGGGQVASSPGQAVTAIDTTGAGDAFAAGYLHAIGSGADPAEALHAANLLASKACQRLGGRP